MKYLTILLSLLFTSNLYAEMQTSFCNAIDGGALSVQFDEAKQIVLVNKISQTKVSIDEKSMRFWNDKYAYTFNRAEWGDDGISRGRSCRCPRMLFQKIIFII
jgi:hypothetical protein